MIAQENRATTQELWPDTFAALIISLLFVNAGTDELSAILGYSAAQKNVPYRREQRQGVFPPIASCEETIFRQEHLKSFKGDFRAPI